LTARNKPAVARASTDDTAARGEAAAPEEAGLETAAALEQLLATRSIRHHVAGQSPFDTLGEVERFVGERQIVLLTGRGTLPSLPEAIAGRPLTGSWWSQPEAHHIYALLEAAEAEGLFAGPLLTAPLVSAKHPGVAPTHATCVERLAADPERRRRALEGCSPLARQLMKAVDRDGSVRMDRPDFAGPSGRRARLELERGLLVFATSVHTETGRHVSVLQPWAAAQIARSARDPLPGFEDALATLIGACLRSAVVATEREAANWFRLGLEPGRVISILKDQNVRRFRVAGRTWLASPQS
jgi:hypothetical protein